MATDLNKALSAFEIVEANLAKLDSIWAQLAELLPLKWSPERSQGTTSDAVQWIEKHNQSNSSLRIEMWPNSHLERLLAERPHLIAEFKLRKMHDA